MGACCCSNDNNSGPLANRAQKQDSAYEEWQFVTEAVGIGSAEVATDYSFLKRHNFTHVVSIGHNFSKEFDDINYLIFNNILDAPFQSLNAVLKEVIEFITEAESQGRKVFIHCLRGLSRSSALLFGYVMFKKRIGYDQAREIVQKKRPMANPNLGFELQLRTFEKANFDFASLDNLGWDRPDVWIPKIQEYAPVILEKAMLMEERYKQGGGDELQNDLMTYTFHFITIHNELDKMNAATRRTTDEFVKWILNIQKKYIHDESTYDRLTKFFEVSHGFENIPLRSLEEYELENEAATNENVGNGLNHVPVTTNAAKASDEGIDRLTEETPLIGNGKPGGGEHE